MAASQPLTGSKPESVFYGWYIAITALFVYFLTNGSAITLPPVYYPTLIREFQTTEKVLPNASGITLLLAGILAPIGGYLIERIGIRWMMCVGTVLLAAALTAYGFATSIAYIFLMHVLFAVALTLCGLYVSVALLSNWFFMRRGAVIGLLVTGSSFAGAILPNIIAPIISRYGWRWGYWSMAAVVWALAVPLVYGVIRDTPTEMGLSQDGLPPRETNTGTSKQTLPGLTLWEAMRTSVFYFLAIGSALIWYAILAVQTYFKLYLERDLKMSNEKSALLLSLIFFFSVGGKFIFGFLADKYEKRRVMIWTTILLSIGSVFLLTYSNGSLDLARETAQLVVFAVIFGLGYGGTFSLIQLMVQECFGPREIGRILGTVALVDTIGAVIGISVTGALRNAGNSLLAFKLVILVAFLSLLNVYFVRPLAKTAS